MLDAYLVSAARERFSWGRHDCAMFIADWVLLCSGRDPASSYRGTYSCAASARSVAGRGGIVSIISRCATSAGLRRISDHPVHGDVAVITDCDGITMCAIRCRTGWAAMMARGICIIPDLGVAVRAAWRV